MVRHWQRSQRRSISRFRSSRKGSRYSLADGADPIKRCSNKGEVQICEFGDKAYQQSVTAFKELNLMNGRHTQHVLLIMRTEKGKLSRITIGGTRKDLPNLMVFMGYVANAMMAIEGKRDVDKTLTVLREELEIARGDDSPSIGQPLSTIQSWGEVTCSSKPSYESMLVACGIVPRS